MENESWQNGQAYITWFKRPSEDENSLFLRYHCAEPAVDSMQEIRVAGGRIQCNFTDIWQWNRFLELWILGCYCRV